MLVLMCEAGDNRYALDTSCVVEIVPFIRLERMSAAPAWLPGMFVYRGRAVHVVDLTHLTTGRPCPARRNSRIIVARFELPNVPPLLGLLAERVTTAEINLDAQTAKSEQDTAELATYGRVLLDERGMFQLIEPARLLADERLQAFQPIVSESRG
ncbi:MAG: chemotaxis protein CheW [Pirellulales bacterium]|nr:chemotaxis protein CheW [Pirellulales bacterium]